MHLLILLVTFITFTTLVFAETNNVAKTDDLNYTTYVRSRGAGNTVLQP